MLVVFKALVAAFWLLTIGLGCVWLELSRVRLGHRIYLRQLELDAVEERIRALEIRYNELVSPDLLERELGEFYELPAASTFES